MCCRLHAERLQSPSAESKHELCLNSCTTGRLGQAPEEPGHLTALCASASPLASNSYPSMLRPSLHHGQKEPTAKACQYQLLQQPKLSLFLRHHQLGHASPAMSLASL